MEKLDTEPKKYKIRPRKRKIDLETKHNEKLRSKLLKKEKKRILPKKKPDNGSDDQIVFPTITKFNINSFFHCLKKKDVLTKSQKDVKKCLEKMNSSLIPLWTSPLYMMHAIRDCVLKRKWNNLTHILSILVTLPDERYKTIIAELCPILEAHHSVIQNSYIQGQLNMLVKKSKEHRVKYCRKDLK